ncbi:MAG TPA: magnesium transporter CorA family protein [Phototrophicaceae bacterium]|jgi:magnesium transporter|nr:magnesium transporter CorA family protein [Phototrophicaceae bacterium]
MIRSLVITSNPKPSDDEAAETIPGDEISLRRNLTQENLEKCFAEGSTIWIDIVTPEAREIRWIEGLLQLSSTVVEDLLREDRRPTLLVYPGYLFLSLFQPYAQSNGMVGKEIHCIIGGHFYITVRQADASALEEAYDRVAQNPASWRRGVAYFLYLTAQHVIDTYYPLLDRISNQLNDLEEKLLNDSDDKQAQKSVYRIKQHLIGLRQMIAPQREVLSNLIGEERVSSDDNIRDLFRHLYERLLGIYDVIDSQRDLTGNVLEIIANQQSRKMGETVNRLTVFSMVFLPFTFFVGLIGLNFVTIETPVVLQVNGLVMLTVITLLMVASVAGMFLIFHRRGWI